MKVLFIITHISDIMLHLLIEEKNKNDVVVITPYLSVKNKMTELDISCYMIRQKTLDISEKDRLFAQEMLPGKMDSYDNFPNTDLPVWKVLSLDRLKFWFDHTAKDNFSLIDGISPDKIYVSLDLDSPYPWYISDAYDSTELIAVQVAPIKTSEFKLFSALLDFDKYFLYSSEDKEFLEPLVGGEVIVRPLKAKGKKTIDPEQRKYVKSKAGLTGEVIGVLFDKRDEWQVRKFLSDTKEVTMLLFPVDKRSGELVQTVLSGFNFLVQNNSLMLLACDKIVAFRWDDRYFDEDVPDTFVIVDPANLNSSKSIAPNYVKVV